MPTLDLTSLTAQELLREVFYRAFDQPTARLRVAIDATVAGGQEILIDHWADSIRIGNGSTTNPLFLAMTQLSEAKVDWAAGGTLIGLGNLSLSAGNTTSALSYLALSAGQTSLAIGNTSLALGVTSLALGNTTSALSYLSLSAGQTSLAIGNTSLAMGITSLAIGNTALATLVSTVKTQSAVTDRSGTTSGTAATSTTLMAANSTRKYLFVQNTDPTGAAIFINFTSAASTTVAGSVKLGPGAAFVQEAGFVSNELITVAGELVTMNVCAKEA